MTTRPPSRAITAVGLALVAAVGLAGCTHTSSPAPTASSAPSSAAAGTNGTSGTPGSSASATPIGRPIGASCDTLVPASTFTVYGRTFTLERGAHPRAGSPGATIVAQRGTACVWRDADGVTVTVAVAELPTSALTRLKDSLYENSNSVPTYTVEGYFDVTNGLGRADAFPDPYWVDAESTMFGEPGDAQPLLDAVRAALVPSGTSTPAATTTTAPTS